VNQRRRKFSVFKKKWTFLAQVDANKETYIAVMARLGNDLSTLNSTVRNRQTLKSVMHSVAGSLVQGRAGIGHHFKNWRVCLLLGLNTLEAAMN
jgi:hypothetical protein